MKVIIEMDYKDVLKPHECEMNWSEIVKYYQDIGWLYEKKQGVFYYIVNIPFLPQVGQELGTRFGPRTVTYSCYELEEFKDSPYLERTRIIVSEQ